MIGNHSLILRGGIGIVMSACAVVSWMRVPRLRIASASFLRPFMATYAVSRLGLYTLAMLVLHLRPQGDVILYMEEGAPALAGKLVYRDFLTPHAPLSPYFLASMLRLHNSPLTLILFAILFDIATIYIWLKAASFFLDPITLQRAALLVLFSPTSLITEAIDGQMNAFIALCLALAVYALVCRRDLLSGALVAVPACAVKFITLMYAPGFLFASRRKLTASAGFVAVILIPYVSFALAGADLAGPLRAEGAHITCSNLTFLIELVTGRSLGLRLPDAFLALSWLLIVSLTFLAMRRASGSAPANRRRVFYLLTISLIAELLCIIVFSKNTWDRYLVMAMFPLCTLVAEMTLPEVIGYAVFATVAGWEPTYWALMLNWTPALQLHARLLAGDHLTLIMLAAELVEVGGSLYLWIACLRRLAAIPAIASTATPDLLPQLVA